MSQKNIWGVWRKIDVCLERTPINEYRKIHTQTKQQRKKNTTQHNQHQKHTDRDDHKHTQQKQSISGKKKKQKQCHDILGMEGWDGGL